MKFARTVGSFLACLLAIPGASASEDLCAFSSNSLIGLESEYAFGDLGKLSIVGFEPTVSYVSSAEGKNKNRSMRTKYSDQMLMFALLTTPRLLLVSGSIPSLTILGASETPLVYIDETGVLTLSTGTCTDAESPCPDDDLVDSVDTSSSNAKTSLAIGSFLMTLFVPDRFAPLSGVIMAATLLGSLAPAVLAAGNLGGCMPALNIEISMPMGAQVTEKFGETDHYLAATVDTVTWGYYDPEATPKITMESGETITVEVITHHGGHDYEKMIRGDPAIEEIFYWEAGQSEETKPEPKLPGTGVHLITGPIEVTGAEVGDVIQIDILELDPRLNSDGRCFGSNSQKFAGYHYRVETMRDGTPYVRTGGTEAITVFEFVEDENGDMLPQHDCSRRFQSHV
jgi:hypothetical protein